MSTFGRQEYMVNNTVVPWLGTETALVVVDMWDRHWCASATTRVAELATPMDQFVTAARAAGATVVWAPSDVTAFYANTSVRDRTLALAEAALPPNRPVVAPPLPLSTATDGGCDTACPQGSPWRRQIASLQIDEHADFLISSDPSRGLQELWNVLSSRGTRRLLYLGVHENMCILGRPFAIEAVRAHGWARDAVSVVRELTDVMYSPRDSPYVSHAEGLALHTAYIEKFWASSVSMYDVLAPSYGAACAAA